MASLSDVRAEDVLNTARQPLLVLDDHLHIVAANRAFQTAFRSSEGQLEGASLYAVADGAWNAPGLRARLDELLPAGKELRDFQLDQVFGGIGRRVLLLSAREILQDAGRRRLILLSIEDVTERITSEQATHDTTQELRRSNRDLLEFASIASHDLKEPVRKIRALGDLLERQLGERLDVTSRDTLERMQNVAAGMSVLVADLLAYARVGHSGEQDEDIKLADILRDVLTELDGPIARAGAQVSVGALPVLTVDRTQIRQLFINLISNSLKFARPGVPPAVRIEARALETGDWQLSVADNGIGFEPQHAERIFGMFQRLHGRTLEGTGIGLALSRRIVEQHGGTIRAEGFPGSGARFTITLPSERARAYHGGLHGHSH